MTLCSSASMSSLARRRLLSTVAFLASLIFAPPIAPVLGLLAAAAMAQSVYVDEAGALASWADLGLARAQLLPLPPLDQTASPPADASCSASSTSDAKEQLMSRLEALDLKPVTHDANVGTCSCTSVSAVVRALKGDGTEALLLAVEAGTANEVVDVDRSREAALALQLAAHLRSVAWLSKDVVLLFHPRCPCGSSPLRHFLAEYSLAARGKLGGHSGDITTALNARRAGLLRQLIALSPPRPQGEREEWFRNAESAPTAFAVETVEVELSGTLGRLPNLDMYASLWAVAQHADVQVPLELPAARPLGRLRASVGAGVSTQQRRGRLERQSLARLSSMARGAASFAMRLGWAEAHPAQASGLAYAIDSLTLTIRSSPFAPPDSQGPRPAPLTDRRLLALLEGTVRCYSNLHESLHHSHYAYLLADADTLIPFQLSGPLLYVPPILSLVLRAGASRTSVHPPASAYVRAAASVGLVHAVGLAWLLLPLSPYAIRPPATAGESLSQTDQGDTWTPVSALHRWSVALGMHAAWALLAAWVCHRGGRSTRDTDALVGVTCFIGLCICLVFLCVSPAFGLLGVTAFAGLAVFGLPPPSQSGSHDSCSSPVAGLVWIAAEVMWLVLASPAAVLCVVAALAAPGASTTVGAMVSAYDAAWRVAHEHGALPYAFGCVAMLPLTVVIASTRLARIERLARALRRARMRHARGEHMQPTSFAEALRVAQKLPKTQLHLHLDGSLPASFLRARAAARGIAMPLTNRELRRMIDEMKGTLKQSDDACINTAVAPNKNWPIFDLMNRFLQTYDELADATCELCTALRCEHEVWYAEVRFCPALHTCEGLSEDEAVRAVVCGFERARAATGLRGGILLCALRSYPAPHPLDTARLARAHLGRGVLGFDVAGSETYPLSLPAVHEALRACVAWGVPITAHAGELPHGMLSNLRCAMNLPVQRLGHGIGLAYGEAVATGEAEELLRLAAASGVVIEACLTGNLVRGRVRSYAEHPVRRMVDAGLRVCLNVDNLTLSGDPEYAGAYPLHDELSYSYPSGEVAHLVADCGFSWAEARTLLLNGVHAAFGAEADGAFVAEFEAALDEVLAEEGLLL